ncbi:MAG: 30S ribosomal protein S4 [Nitrospirae bacterium]|nr:30S ribosomal protein S4 [Candidatus Troglogloeales bacterium]MBI3598990.1 30S ribosomal protein S4 [Candidatus Troglogloeales bacterium]
MGRYTGSVCRLCRREGVKLFLKGPRCFTEKCAIDRRSTIPGQHGAARPRLTEYSLQLREKQKLKRIYGLVETQFKRYFFSAERKKEITGEALLVLLESRLDNIVYRAGFALSRKQARMLIRQNHFQVNGSAVNIPSSQVLLNDFVEVRAGSRALIPVKEAMARVEARGVPDWLELEQGLFKATVTGRPTKEAMALPVNEQLVVELYSR